MLSLLRFLINKYLDLSKALSSWISFLVAGLFSSAVNSLLATSATATPVAALPTPAKDILSGGFGILLFCGTSLLGPGTSLINCPIPFFFLQFRLRHELLQNFCAPLRVGRYSSPQYEQISFFFMIIRQMNV